MIYYTYCTYIIYIVYYLTHKIPEVNSMDVNIWKNKSAQILWTVSFHSKRSHAILNSQEKLVIANMYRTATFLGTILSVNDINNGNGCHSCAH